MNTLTKEIKNRVWEILTTNIVISVGFALLPYTIVLLFGVIIIIML